MDRGFNSVETISYVLILKILYKDRITLLRGNHENKYPSCDAGKSTKSMASMRSASKSTETRTSGRCSPIYSTTCHWLRLYKGSSIVCTVGCHPRQKKSIKSSLLTEYRRFHMRELCVICCGLTRRIISMGSGRPHGRLGTFGATTKQRNSSTITTYG